MFCLRIWLLPLFFLFVPRFAVTTVLELIRTRSSAPPLYLLLFLSATYVLQRPCVYCSLLLAILVISLFDFQSNWFEPRRSSTNADPITPRSLQNISSDTISIVASAMNATASMLAETLVGKIQRPPQVKQDWWTWGAEWTRSVITKRELRIPCVNAVIRL